MFRRKLLLLLGLMATLTGAYADDNGTLAIANVQNAVQGKTGSLDIVLSGSPRTYRDFQFDITLPAGLTYTVHSAGALLNGHTIQTSGSGTIRFTGYSTNTLTAANGTLLTISFTVAESATAGANTVTLANAVFSDDAAKHYILAAGDNTVTVTGALTLSDDDTAAPTPASGVNVTLSRSFEVNKWYTICLPFALTAEKLKTAFGANVKVGDFSGYTVSGSAIGVNFTTVTAMAANHPYIIKVTDGAVNNPTFNGVDIVAGTPVNNKGTDATDANIKAMIGVYEETTLESNWLYIKDNRFKYSTGTSKVKPYRAYFRFCDFTDAMHSRSIIIVEDGATGIRLIDGDRADGDWYDLSGRRLSGKPASKGVYIQNGKKVVIK
ncbi:MAG: hypothetical protein J5952_01890 [Prevotella sp.]|nr:hypothetical protein [Prevotella sp.]